MDLHNEAEEIRLSALKRLLVMDSSEEQAYDDITRLAASVCGTPIALISLVDDKRQWFKARVGLVTKERQVLGTLCVIDRVPRILDEGQLETLQFLALQVMAMLEANPELSVPLATAVDKNASVNLQRLRQVIAEERSSLPPGSSTMRLLIERMRKYETGEGLAPTMAEFLAWRDLVELDKARTHFSKAAKRPEK